MPEFTPYHSQYLAHRLTLEGVGDEGFARSLSTARVEMKPHQIDAALFALKSPLSKGAILADEVGLGKTIEAGLVIAQRWAERRRRILLIVPASLRKQWTQELHDKFSLESEILESKTYRELKKSGKARPFDAGAKVVVASYEFAARQADEIALVAWDLVVFDEAHRLRNVYKKNGSARAKQLRSALQERFKVLLTATPLQNSLLELFGLVSVVDDRFFGDENAFKVQYSKNASAATLPMLRERLKSICRRTLRRQVLEAGHINYTKRLSHTFQFEPHDREAQLYEIVSAYLQRPGTYAFGEKANQLVILVYRKILGSSTAALVQTLENTLQTLKARRPADFGVVADIDTVEEIAEEADEDSETSVEPIDEEKLASEIEEVEGFVRLARSIAANAKGEKLVGVLPSVLDEIVQRGGNRKAVIFTESVRTQRYLRDLLSENGFRDEIILMNGSNNDPESQSAYADWTARHKGTEAISGSKSADMKAAIVDAFRDRKSILIATESGAEGINLQFCSLVVNFDLPWNPQRVEQRIGRCHRYGQKIDVTVVNFLNLKNHAEIRVHELLEQKFKLFDGVFGASDEVLGAIASGVDFERKVLEIVQASRTEEEINAAFAQLEAELQESIASDMLETREKILTHMDADVVRLLKERDRQIEGVMNAFDQRLMTLARAELPEARFHADKTPRFDWDGVTYTTEWPLADENGWRFFRLSDGNLATEIAERAKARALQSASIIFSYAPQLHGVLADVEKQRGRKGWLKASMLTLKSARQPIQHLLLAAVTDGGEAIDEETLDRFFLLPGRIQSQDSDLAPALIEERETLLQRNRLNEAAERNAAFLSEETEKLDAYAEDLEKALDAEIKALDAEIKDKRKALRAAGDIGIEEKIAAQREIKKLEGRKDDLNFEKYERRKQLRRQVEDMLDEVEKSLRLAPALAPLFAIRWEIEE